MNWEKLAAPEFEKAIEKCARVCVIPMGVLEKHGDHLPLGMDLIDICAVAERAAVLEDVMLFPGYYFSQNTHAKCQPGAIAIRFDLMFQLLESVCDEIARNGFTKIIIANGHGGNTHFLNHFQEKLLDVGKPYFVYWTFPPFPDSPLLTSKTDGHGGERETSTMMVLHPELVKSETPASYGLSMEREETFAKLGVRTPTWWYAMHPAMLSADATPASREKGELILEHRSKHLADVIRLVKKDDTPIRLYREFMERCRVPRDTSA